MKKPSLKPTWIQHFLALAPGARARRPQAARTRPRARLRLEALEDRCVPATITVNSTADTAAPPTGTVTLRSAITQAEADTTPDTITFAGSLFGQTITLGGTALPTLTKGETITGPGAELLTISANNASRIFVVTSTTNVTISGLTLTRGNAGTNNNGGAILNNGLLTLTNDTFTNNTTAGTGSGGAVANVGATAQLTVNTCTFTQNNSTADGGAILNSTAGAQLTVNGSTFSSNTCNEGGAIFNGTGTTATISGSTFTGNSGAGSGDGAAIYNVGTMTLTNSTLAFNTGRGTAFFGGAIRNDGSLSVTACAIYGNLSEGQGGGIDQEGTLLNVTNSTIANNTALNDDGGGGINVRNGPLTLLNDTITGNLDASGAATNAGGVAFHSAGTFTTSNTIIALNHATGAGAPPDVRGAVAGGSVNNFIGIGTAALTGITDGTNGNQIGTTATPKDPKLGPLQNNGGPTLSEKPLLVTPATVIDKGNNAAAATLTTDQRGSQRVVGTAVDIGSVEFQPPDITFALTVQANNNAVTQVPQGTTVTLTATVTPTATAPNAPVTGTVTFLAGTAVLGTATVGANGVATLTLTNPPIGHLSITAQYSGDLNYPAVTTAVSQLFVVPKFTVGAYDPLLGTWQLRSANSSGPADAGSFQFGGFGPSGFADGLVGDWQGNGQFTPAVFYPATGTWFLRNSNGPNNALVVPAFSFGGPTTIPIAGDWFGDGHFDIGVYDVTSGTFFLRHGLNSGAVTTFQLGGPGFYPIAGDFTGSGTWTVGVVQLSTMTWFIKTSNTPGAANIVFQWGSQNPGGAAVLPVVGDWGGSGHYGIGLVVPVQNAPGSPFNNQDIFLLRNEVNAGFADAGFFAFGAAGDTPVAGQWSLPTNPLSFQLAEGEGPGAASITQADLGQAVAAALGRLQQAGVSSAVLGQLAAASYQVTNLPAGQLGYTANGRVQVSADGAGHGWFVDPTPGQDEEFSGGVALAGGAATGREDLLTVVLHEMAHLIGVNDGGAGLMAEVLPTGTRRIDALDAVFAGA